ncbi:twin-arginine translocase TatA/TatE family subunit [Pseudomonas aeruginosa]|uniref:twin-arginine translocase TatA/TatE family subunit n=1 Tax=Pseudomonas aeruginosa TaxID=287 RepID=UPI001892A6DB|nr:twin-arginine translocase TatA/TatE family subunit [Pseudomonas aeruginosa]
MNIFVRGGIDRFPGEGDTMGFAGISLWKVGVVLVLLLVFFGGKRLRGLGADAGAAVKGFRQSLREQPPRLQDEAGVDRQTDS